MPEPVVAVKSNKLSKFTVYISPPQPDDPSAGCYHLVFYSTHKTEENTMAAIREAIRDYLSVNPYKPMNRYVWGDTRLKDIPDSVWRRHGLFRDHQGLCGEGGCEFVDWDTFVFRNIED